MKKLYLLIVLTLVFTFSITTVSVSASNIEITPGDTIENLLHGNFENISENDWYTPYGVISNYVEDCTAGDYSIELIYTGTGTAMITKELTLDAEHKYYFNVDVKIPHDNTEIAYNVIFSELDNASSSLFIHSLDSSDSSWQTTSGVITISEYTNIQISVKGAISSDPTASTAKYYIDRFMLIDLTTIYGPGLEPTTTEFESVLKVSYFEGSVTADSIILFDNNSRIDHYMYDVPDIFEDFPSNVTMENIIRIAFFIPLMIIFYLLIPLFNFVLSGSATGSIMLGLLILAFILREVIRFIDPDFHLFGKNSYYEGFKSTNKKE